MSELESIEKLHGYFTGDGMRHSVIHALIDDVEREVSERFMELPVDANGVPIRVGDMLECHANGYDGIFKVFTVGDNVVIEDEDKQVVSAMHIARFCCHVKPRTIEDVLDEFLHTAAGACAKTNCELEEQIAKYAAELRGMMETER